MNHESKQSFACPACKQAGRTHAHTGAPVLLRPWRDNELVCTLCGHERVMFAEGGSWSVVWEHRVQPCVT